jgi:tRNA dimethylallyltransferase
MNNIVCIIGTTACGKTRMGVRLAACVDGEIISADSRQIYKDMSIGTGKDLYEYIIGEQTVPYHLIDIAETGSHYNVFEYKKDFYAAYQDIVARQKVPILCGGSGMYIEAILQDYQLDYVPKNYPFRNKANTLTDKALINMLQDLKPLHNTTDTSDRQRLIRAIEIALHQETHTSFNIRKWQPQIYYLQYDNNIIRRRIADRLNLRLSQGMVEEVESLFANGMKAEDIIYYGLEYKYVALYLTAKLTYEDMVEKLFIAICQFAKRQRTWFRKMQRNGFIFKIIDCDYGEDAAFESILTHYRVHPFTAKQA